MMLLKMASSHLTTQRKVFILMLLIFHNIEDQIRSIQVKLNAELYSGYHQFYHLEWLQMRFLS